MYKLVLSSSSVNLGYTLVFSAFRNLKRVVCGEEVLGLE